MELLGDTETRELMIRKLREGGHVAATDPSTGRLGSGTFTFPPMSGSVSSGQPWPMFPMQFPFAPYLPCWGPSEPTILPTGQSLPGSASSLGQPGSASSLGQVEEGEEGDVVSLLGDEEAMEFTNFDPTVADESTWDAGDTINEYLEKILNRELPEQEREQIMKDFPRTRRTCTSTCEWTIRQRCVM